MSEVRSLRLGADQVSGITCGLLTFKSRWSAWPHWSSSAQGNSSNFRFIHFCLLAGDPLAHPLWTHWLVAVSFWWRLLIVTSILNSHSCLLVIFWVILYVTYIGIADSFFWSFFPFLINFFSFFLFFVSQEIFQPCNTIFKET